MYRGKEITIFIEENKSIIWGLFLSTIIFKFAIGNIFLGILLAFFLAQLFQNKKFIFNKSILPIAIYFLWGVASLLWTTNISNTVKGIGATLPLIIIPVLISQYSDFKVNDLRKTFRVFSICLLLYFLACIVNASFLFFNDKQLSHFFYHNLVSIFNNNAIYISLAVAICILININLSKNVAKDYLLISLLSIFLLVLSSKNIIITTFLLGIVTLFIHKKNIKTVFITSLVISVIALFLIISDNPIKERFLKELNLNTHYILFGQDFYDYGFSGFEVRLFQWRLMGEMIQNHQVGILGLGLHNVDYLLNQYFSYYNLYKGYFYINFHNQFLQTLGELGFVGLALLLWVFIKSIYSALKFRNKYEMLFVLLFMMAFFTESFLSRQKGVFLFAIMYSLIFAYSNSKEKGNKKLDNNSKALLI